MVSKNQELEKEITFLIKVMNGGGAERVISILSTAMAQRGYKVTLILTHQSLKNAILYDIHKSVRIISLLDSVERNTCCDIQSKCMMLYARILEKLNRLIFRKESNKGLIYKYYARNLEQIYWLKKYFKEHSNSKVVAFLYDTIFLTMASITENNRVIISERGDPEQSRSSKTTMAFLHDVFPKADQIVFQSPDVQKWYQRNTGIQGVVVFNPVKRNLPERFVGERRKRIVNFCRISDQKNLELLVDAFDLFHKEYSDYELYIYGDAVGNGAEGYLEKIHKKIYDQELGNCVHLLKGRKDIHEEIRDYTMFVSSSDYEGMSNSMLEAMAIGLPSICTDCPAGGARAVINDHENGILVPVGDAHQMYLAMKELVEDAELAERLSLNGCRIKDELAIDNIIEKWMEIIND